MNSSDNKKNGDTAGDHNFSDKGDMHHGMDMKTHESDGKHSKHMNMNNPADNTLKEEHNGHTEHKMNMTGTEHEHKHTDHTAHHKMMIADFRRRFIISTLLTVPVLILSPAVQSWLGYGLTFPGVEIILAILSSIIYFYGGWPFLKGAYDELRKKLPGMMLLIAVAISVAYFYSIFVLLGLKGNPFFWELATLIDIMLLGHWIEMRSVLGASSALEKLVKLLPRSAHLILDEGVVKEVPVTDLKKGDRILIRPGEKIPSDGIIVKGESYVDESMLTGESVPVKKGPGDTVIAGSINGDSSFEVTVEKTGEESYLAKVIKLVKAAQESKSRTQALADRAAFVLTVVSISVGVFTLIFWLIFGPNPGFAVERMATVMVITCPHALGLAIPLVVAVSTAESARNGLLIRNRTAFENSRKITSVLFDKTGTLTEGRFGVNKITVYGTDYDKKKVMGMAASLELGSEHPIARGITEYARKLGAPTYRTEKFRAIKGKGVEAVIDGHLMSLVSPAYLKEPGIKFPEEYESVKAETVVFLIKDKKALLAMITLSDQIRVVSFAAVKELQNMGIKCIMVTGDNGKTAEYVANRLGLDGFYAEVLPHKKLEIVEDLQHKGEFVAMTGDGINDAPALAKADVGIAIGSGTDIAAETADIILVNSDVRDVTALIKFGRATYRKMIQNLGWATGYNVFAIPLAAGLLYPWGIVISPAIGAVLMSLSTVIVSINARLLKLDRNK